MLEQTTEDAIEAGELVKCEPWGKDQGDFVLVNACNFDPDFHKPLGSKASPSPAPAKPRATSKKRAGKKES